MDLKLLIDNLKTLWNKSIELFDAYHHEKFTMKAILTWTVNNFSAYDNLSSHIVKGTLSFPI